MGSVEEALIALPLWIVFMFGVVVTLMVMSILLLVVFVVVVVKLGSPMPSQSSPQLVATQAAPPLTVLH